MKECITTTEVTKYQFCSRQFCGPVLIASIIGVGLSFLLSLLSLAFGFIAFSANQSGELAFSVGGFISLAIISIITMFFIGWLAAYLGRSCYSYRYTGELYGLATWSLTLILSILLASSTSKFMTNYERFIYKTAPMVTVAKIENHIAPEKYATDKKADIASMTTFVIFFLFFIGALSSCLGGRVAMHFARSYPDSKGSY